MNNEIIMLKKAIARIGEDDPVAIKKVLMTIVAIMEEKSIQKIYPEFFRIFPMPTNNFGVGKILLVEYNSSITKEVDREKNMVGIKISHP